MKPAEIHGAGGLLFEKSLSFNLVFENKVNSWAHWYGGSIQSFLDKLPNLLMGIETLKCASGGQHPIPKWFHPPLIFATSNLDRYDEELGCQGECIFQYGLSLARIFNHVENKPEVDDISALFQTLRMVKGVPTISGVAELLKPAKIVALATAIIKKTLVFREDIELQEFTDRQRETKSGDRCS